MRMIRLDKSWSYPAAWHRASRTIQSYLDLLKGRLYEDNFVARLHFPDLSASMDSKSPPGIFFFSCHYGHLTPLASFSPFPSFSLTSASNLGSSSSASALPIYSLCLQLIPCALTFLLNPVLPLCPSPTEENLVLSRLAIYLIPVTVISEHFTIFNVAILTTGRMGSPLILILLMKNLGTKRLSVLPKFTQESWVHQGATIWSSESQASMLTPEPLFLSLK